jgi:hypothetical protein|tara:strand:+ start:580 stop:996 length:417 start_codon:yes stop_codon:yes gene_type:complete
MIEQTSAPKYDFPFEGVFERSANVLNPNASPVNIVRVVDFAGDLETLAKSYDPNARLLPDEETPLHYTAVQRGENTYCVGFSKAGHLPDKKLVTVRGKEKTQAQEVMDEVIEQLGLDSVLAQDYIFGKPLSFSPFDPF